MVPQFPQTEKGVYWPLPRRRRGEPRGRRVLMPQESGKQRVLRAASSSLELLEFVAFDTIAS